MRVCTVRDIRPRYIARELFTLGVPVVGLQLAEGQAVYRVGEGVVSSSADVMAALSDFYRRRADDREHFLALYLSSKHAVLAAVEVSVGSLNLALVHPRDVFAPALVLGGVAGVVLSHNHPSGNPEPSGEDVELTRQMVRAGDAVGIQVMDHVICGDGRYYSFADARALNGRA